jgi:hypothetical protein|tara:strand:+ start:8270 stop:8794 length:525 start_codon:yes stop_codon:yes gene_type:complete
MIYNAPAKGDDGLYFVKALNDDKRKSLIQLNGVKIADVSGEVVMDAVSELNIAKIVDFDTRNLEAAYEKCSEWFGKQLSENVIKSAYTPSLKDDQVTGDHLDGVTKVFNAQQEVAEFESVQPGKNCDVILEFAGLWFAKKAFGPTWNVVQVRVHDDPTIDIYPDGYAFVDEIDQ